MPLDSFGLRSEPALRRADLVRSTPMADPWIGFLGSLLGGGIAATAVQFIFERRLAFRRVAGERFVQRRMELLEELGVLHSRAQRMSVEATRKAFEGMDGAVVSDVDEGAAYEEEEDDLASRFQRFLLTPEEQAFSDELTQKLDAASLYIDESKLRDLRGLRHAVAKGYTNELARMRAILIAAMREVHEP